LPFEELPSSFGPGLGFSFFFSLRSKQEKSKYAHTSENKPLYKFSETTEATFLVVYKNLNKLIPFFKLAIVYQ